MTNPVAMPRDDANNGIEQVPNVFVAGVSESRRMPKDMDLHVVC